jgi:type I restriction enzyme S subunit
MEQVKKGYKKTEVGIIPDIWSVKPLGEITNLVTNGFVGTATTHYSEALDSILYIQGYNVEANSFKFQGIKRVTSEFHKQHQKSSLKEGDLLTIQTGDVGLTTIVPKELEGSNCHALIISRFKPSIVFPKFYVQYFNSTEGRARLKELETGTTMKHLNVGDMLFWNVPVPTLAEQKAIATALSDVDELIKNLEKLITKKKAIKQGAMQQLLTPPDKGGKRLEGFSGEWETKLLGEIGHCIIGLTYSPDNVVSDGTLVLRSSNVQENKLAFNDNVYVNSLIPDNLRVREGDILICVRNGSRQLIGKCAILDKSVDGQTFGAFMSVFRTEYSTFVFQLFQSNDIKRQIDENLGATINQITNKVLNSFSIPFPTIEEQKAIAEILSDIDSEIERLEIKRAKYQRIKQGMMQELLTGKTRLV